MGPSNSPPPLLIVGMHRSGTALVSRIADRLGIHMGWKLQGDHEAVFFVRLNQWMLDQAGADWDWPQPVDGLLAHEALAPLIDDYLRVTLQSPRSLEFLGPRRLLTRRSVFALDEPWGWKDPRTTLLLPVWLRLFPNARVLHVLRHGVDVAQSLKARNERNLVRRTERAARLRWTYRLRAKDRGFINSVRCESLDAGVDLWLDYVKRAHEQVRLLGDQAMEVRYEDLLERPLEGARAIAKFAGIDAPAGALEEVCAGVDASRAYAYRKSPELQELAERRSADLGSFGYGLHQEAM